MKTKGKTFFAFFAVALMLLSAGVVLMGDQGAAEGNAQQITTGTPTIKYNNGNPIFENATDTSGKEIAGFTWNNSTKTLTMDGVNYKYTGEGRNAFNVESDVTDVTINIRNSNSIVGEGTNRNGCACINIGSNSEITITGTDPKTDIIKLESLIDESSYGLMVLIGASVDIIKVSLIINMDSKAGSSYGTYILSFEGQTPGIINISKSYVSSNVKTGNMAIALFCTTITESFIDARAEESLSSNAIGAWVSSSITKSIVVATAGKNPDEYTASVGLFFSNYSNPGNFLITDSIIDATGGPIANIRSMGIMLLKSDSTLTVKNSIINAKGEDSSMCSLENAAATPLPLNTSSFVGNMSLKVLDSNTGEYIPVSGEIDLKYKEFTSTPIRSVTYDLNNGTGKEITQDVEQTSEYTIRDLEPTMKGFKFVGWSDGTKIYQPGDTYEIGWEDITFTAVWEVVPAPPADPSYDYLIPSLAVLLLFVFFIIIGLVMRRRDEDDE